MASITYKCHCGIVSEQLLTEKVKTKVGRPYKKELSEEEKEDIKTMLDSGSTKKNIMVKHDITRKALLKYIASLSD